MQSSSKKPGSETRKLLGTNPKSLSRSEPHEVKEAFARLARARAELAAFVKTNHKVVGQYDQLQASLNSSIAEAKALYEAHKDVLGPSYQGFVVSKRRAIDASLLVELMPDAFGLVKYAMPVAMFDELVADGTIPEDIAEQVETFTESIAVSKK
jgi:hypothetical protein